MTGITRWKPFETMRWSPFDDLFGAWPRDLFGRMEPNGGLSVEWNPRCDVTEADAEIIVHAELPGVDAKDVEVSIQEGALYVRGEKRSEKKEENGNRKYSERFFGSFERCIALPPGVDESKIEAKLKDGVLEIRIPKAKVEPPKEKKITIKAT